jgi:hypothetical protein
MLITLLSFPSLANAGFSDGNELKGQLEAALKDDGNYYLAGVGMGYVVGVYDAGEDNSYCLPDGVTVRQLGSVVLKYLEEHPERLHHRAAFLVFSALVTTWPCHETPTDTPPIPPESTPTVKPKPSPKAKPLDEQERVPASPF